MLKKKLIIISIFLLFIISIGMVSASEDIGYGFDGDNSLSIADDSTDSHSDMELAESISDDYDQENSVLKDEENDGGEVNNIVRPTNNTKEAVQEAIDNANENDIIELEGTYEVSALKVNKSLTFVGISEDTVFSNMDTGLSGTNFFIIGCDDLIVTFKNLKFIGGCDDEGFGKGGAIYSKSSLVIDNCYFALNTAHIGGAIYALGNSSDISITNSIFEKNYVRHHYDWPTAGAIYTDANSLYIENCSFINNTAESDCEYTVTSVGGAIYSINPCKIISSNFTYNRAGENFSIGGIVELFGDSIIENCIFENNIPKPISVHNASLTFINGDNTTNYSGYFTLDNQFNKHSLVATVSNLTTTYGSGKSMDIKFFMEGGNVSDYFILVTLYVFTGDNREIYEIESKYDINGIASFKNASLLGIGTHKVVVKYSNLQYDEIAETVYITVKKATTNVTAAKVSNYFGASKYFKVTVKNKATNKAVNGVKITLKVYTGKTYKTYTIKTNKSGVAVFNTKSLAAGSHKVVISSADSRYTISKNSTITIKKAPTTISAPKISAKYKKSKYFKVTVKSKVTKKLVSGVKVKIKVYTGKKYKTYTVTTNKKGIAKINTKKLRRGKHKVVISSGNKNYSMSKKSLITIR